MSVVVSLISVKVLQQPKQPTDNTCWTETYERWDTASCVRTATQHLLNSLFMLFFSLSVLVSLSWSELGTRRQFYKGCLGKSKIIYPSSVPILTCIITQKSLRSFNPVGLNSKLITHFSGSPRTACFSSSSGFLSGSLNQTSFAF